MPTADYAALRDCDLVIEAVFEDRKVKEEVIGADRNAAGDRTILGSNTSTLPITSLAAAFKTGRVLSAFTFSRRSSA